MSRIRSLIPSSSLTEETAMPWHKGVAAFCYGFFSLAIMLVNKFLLTPYAFPSYRFIALLQVIATIVVLFLQHVFEAATLPKFSWHVFRDVMPLPIFFLGNMLSGLSGTQRLNMPMFVLLRRFSIVMTMILEIFILHRTFKTSMYVSVALMCMGAVIGAIGDFQIDWVGYTSVLTNDLFTALNGVVMRHKLQEKELLGSHGLLFYNSLFSLPVTAAIVFGDPLERAALAAFPKWNDPVVIVLLAVSGFLGFLLSWSHVLCTKLNSPLTTTVIGVFKNVVSVYGGMLFQDYHYSVINFLGINVSLSGAFLFAYYSITDPAKTQLRKQSSDLDPR